MEILIKSGKAENRQTTHGLAFFYFFQQKFSFFPCQFFSINVKPLSPFFFLINLFISHLTVFTDHLDQIFSTSKIANLLLLLGVKGAGSLEP